MKRKITALCIVIAMLAVAIVSSTMAYFTDTDEAVNVMVMGNVDITQSEKERDNAGTLVDFTQAKPLFPTTHIGVDTLPDPAAVFATPGGNVSIWDTDITNEIDKLVYVTNNGNTGAYVRTWLAFELGDIELDTWKALFHINRDTTEWEWSEPVVSAITVDGTATNYAVVKATYIGTNKILEAGDTTLPSLIQIALDKTATKRDVASVGDSYSVLAFTQAMQVAGFESVTPAEALDIAFTSEHPWQGGISVPTYASTASEFAAALAAGQSIILTDDIDLAGVEWTPTAKYSGTLNGNGYAIKNLVSEAGLFESLNGATITNLKIEDATVTAASNHTGILAGSIVKDASAPATVIENVTVSGTVIGGDYYTGGLIGAVSAYHAEITNCTNNANVTSNGQQAGGIVGYAKRDALIENCTNNGDISGSAFVGGIIGLIAGEDDDPSLYVTVKDCVNYGTVTGDSTKPYGGYVGGIAGVFGREGGKAPVNEVTAEIINCTTSGSLPVCGGTVNVATGRNELINLVIMDPVSDGLYKDSAANSYYIYNANGLAAINSIIKANSWKSVKETFNIREDIDASGITWQSIGLWGDNTAKFKINGNNHVISGLNITGGAMFTGLTDDTVVIKDITFDNVTVSGEYHVAVVWGQAYMTDLTLKNVHVTNSEITGTCNVSALVASTAYENVNTDSVTVTFDDCSVTNCVITANGTNCDPTGASVFMGRALGAPTSLVFVDCEASGNTVNNSNGLVGGGIYGYTAIDGEGWYNTGVCNDFTNWNGTPARGN